MSTELKGFQCRTAFRETGDVSMTQFGGGLDDGLCVQLTCNTTRQFMSFTREQALVAAEALLQFANGTRPEAD